jgi:hypothetical protein
MGEKIWGIPSSNIFVLPPSSHENDTGKQESNISSPTSRSLAAARGNPLLAYL